LPQFPIVSWGDPSLDSESLVKSLYTLYLPTVSKIFKNVCFEEDKTPEETHLVYTELTSNYLFEPNAGIGHVHRARNSKEEHAFLLFGLGNILNPLPAVMPLPSNSAVLQPDSHTCNFA
jgi:hypothetical protein